MSGFSSLVERDFGGETRRFRLRLRELEIMQERCDAGPMEILERLARHKWRVQDIRQPILLGLEGGGMGASEALRLVRRYVDDAGPANFVELAYAIVDAAIWLPKEVAEAAGKAEAEAETTATAASPSAGSSEMPS